MLQNVWMDGTKTITSSAIYSNVVGCTLQIVRQSGRQAVHKNFGTRYLKNRMSDYLHFRHEGGSYDYLGRV